MLNSLKMQTIIIIFLVISLLTIFGHYAEPKRFVDVAGYVDSEDESSIPRHLKLKREAESETGIPYKKMARTKVRTPTDWIDGIIAEHNRLRELHGVGPLTQDEELSKAAQFWAEYLGRVSEGRTLPILFRKGWYEVGANLWAAVGRKDAKPISAPFSWYNEERFYTYGNDSFCGMDTIYARLGVYNLNLPHVDHFTQLVWKGTKTVGCAKTKNHIGHIYVVCFYQPPGNMRGEYLENVPKPIKKV